MRSNREETKKLKDLAGASRRQMIAFSSTVSSQTIIKGVTPSKFFIFQKIFYGRMLCKIYRRIQIWKDFLIIFIISQDIVILVSLGKKNSLATSLATVIPLKTVLSFGQKHTLGVEFEAHNVYFALTAVLWT